MFTLFSAGDLENCFIIPIKVAQTILPRWLLSTMLLPCVLIIILIFHILFILEFLNKCLRWPVTSVFKNLLAELCLYYPIKEFLFFSVCAKSHMGPASVWYISCLHLFKAFWLSQKVTLLEVPYYSNDKIYSKFQWVLTFT